MKKKILKMVCFGLEKICPLTHWANPILIKLGLPHCLPVVWCYRLDVRFDLGLWNKMSV